jgi:thioredoxin 1
MAQGSVAVDDATFDSRVFGSAEPVLVDFWAEWCGPCRMMEPVIEEIAEDLGGRLKVAKLNVDENPATAQRFGIVSIPTFLLVHGGQVKRSWIGAMPKARILRELKDSLGVQ